MRLIYLKHIYCLSVINSKSFRNGGSKVAQCRAGIADAGPAFGQLRASVCTRTPPLLLLVSRTVFLTKAGRVVMGVLFTALSVR